MNGRAGTVLRRSDASRAGTRVLSVALAVIAAAASLSVRVSAGTPVTVQFESHGGFFSRETHQPAAIDPQVFIRAPGAPAGVGPQNIRHIAGLAPARLSGPAGTRLYAADGKSLHLTLGRWLAAGGTAEIIAAGAGDRVTVSFRGVIPAGVYSLFEVTFKPSGNTFVPLDGAGRSTSFVALGNGTARATVLTPARLTHADAVLLVYHSDGRAHGTSRGVPGVTAHHQLIARLP